jgi:N-acetylglucosamine-6-phosphate deacetylase
VRLGVREAIVLGKVVPGDVVVGDDGTIEAVGVEPPGRKGTATPGFVDLQVNGFAGVDFLDAGSDGYIKAGRALARTGVTSYQPTFITSSLETYRRALKEAAALPPNPGGPRVLGIHLEGPFLSPAKAGTHDQELMLMPDVALSEELLNAGPVSYMTVAPELPGALELIGQLVARDIVVACGHTEANAETARKAFDMGARAVTHIFNAQRRWEARDPGIAGVALVHPKVIVQAIVDLVHLAPETVLLVLACARGRFAPVTDAVMIAGLDGDALMGRFRIGSRQIHVVDGAVRNDVGDLAGSRATMDESIRNLVGLGMSMPDAVGAATRVPSQLVRRPDLGDISPGTPADLTVLDDRLRVVRTLVAGSEIFAS